MPSVINVYADESSQDDHRYMVLGGVCANAEEQGKIEEALSACDAKHRTFGTKKWGKVSKTKLPIYREYCDTFFVLSAKDDLHFHSLTVDTSKLDHARYNFGSRELGFSKFIYQLLCKFGRIYGSDEQLIHVYLDHRTTKQSLDELRDIVNNGLAKHYGIKSRPIRRLQFRQTEDEALLQMNDVLLGALAYRTNGHHLCVGAAPHKVELSGHVLKSAGITNPLRDTPRRVRRFSTWNFSLQKRV